MKDESKFYNDQLKGKQEWYEGAKKAINKFLGKEKKKKQCPPFLMQKTPHLEQIDRPHLISGNNQLIMHNENKSPFFTPSIKASTKCVCNGCVFASYI